MDELKSKLAKHSSLIVWGIVTLLFSVSLLFLAQFYGEMKSARFIGQGIEFRNTISVSGKGEVTAIPDIAELSFAVVKEAKTVLDAQRETTGTMNGVIEYLKGFGMEEKDIKTIHYNIIPQYEYRSIQISSSAEGQARGVEASYPLIYPPYPPIDREQVLVGYEVSHWVSIKIRKTDDAGKIVAEVGARGATNISGISFTIDDEDKVLREARQKAIDDAKKKARELSGDLGVRLVKVVSFSEYGDSLYFARAELAKFDMAFGGGEPLPPEIPVGENTITSQVTITYAIE